MKVGIRLKTTWYILNGTFLVIHVAAFSGKAKFFFLKPQPCVSTLRDGASARGTSSGGASAVHVRPADSAEAPDSAELEQRRQVRTTPRAAFLMKHEPADGQALVGSPFGLCDHMRTVESRGTEFQGGRRRPLCFRSTEL